MNAVLFHRSAYYQREQRFRDEARFGMMSRGCREWTAVAANEMFAFALVKNSGASKVPQNPERRFYPLCARFVLNFQKVISSYHFPYLSHCRAQLFWTQLFRKNAQQKIEERSVRLWENLLRLRSERIGGVRLPKPRLRARLSDEPVALETRKVRPHRVVG